MLPPVSTTLHFIHIPSTRAGMDRSNQRLVRSHVMKQVHAVKRLNMVEDFQRLQKSERNTWTDPQASSQEGFLGDDTFGKTQPRVQKVRSNRPTRATRKKPVSLNTSIPAGAEYCITTQSDEQPNPDTSTSHQRIIVNPRDLLGAGRVDPFKTYPLPISDIENFIIDYCETWKWTWNSHISD
jgi:hypothetical protein